MKFTLKPTSPAKWDVDVLIFFCWEGEECFIPDCTPELRKIVTDLTAREQFQGKEGQSLIFTPHALTTAYKICIAGIGKRKNFDIFRLQKVVAAAVRKVQTETRPTSIGVSIPREWVDDREAADRVAATVEAIFLSCYRFSTYKSQQERAQIPTIENAWLWVPGGKIAAAEQGIMQGSVAAEATLLARDLVNEPSHVTTPAFLAKTAQSIAKRSKGNVTAEITDQNEIEKLGMRAFLGVAKGSDEPPKLIRLHYKHPHRKKKIVLAGKGITFDTGGLSLKGADHMESMKLDMAGAAAVLAVFHALTQIKPNVEVVGLIAACENMPSGRALKPGDILTAYNGKTIEVLNTDAEGRLTLADVLSYAAAKEKPDVMIDLATLTGACMVGLGADIAGLWSNDDALVATIRHAAAQTGEKVWPMPLESDYRELIKSHIADVKNIQTGRYGGAITAALFLSEFVGNSVWAHLDIAGPSYNEKDTPLIPKGGTGFGVRLLLHILSSLS